MIYDVDNTFYSCKEITSDYKIELSAMIGQSKNNFPKYL